MTNCNQCDVTAINGVICHETGCSESYKDETRECLWCGTDFVPEYSHQKFCDVECEESYWN